MVPEHRLAEVTGVALRAGSSAGARVGRLGGEQSASFLEEVAAETSVQEAREPVTG